MIFQETKQWAFGFLCYAWALLTPLLLLIFGWIFQKHPPRRVNGLYGYRTARSMKSQELWNFAQQLCGRLWWRMGWGLLLLSAAVMLLLRGWKTAAVGIGGAALLGVQILALLGSIVPVERALKRKECDPGAGETAP